MTPLRMTGHGHTGLEPPDSSDAHLSYLHCNRCGFCAHSVRLDADEGLPTTMSGETHLFVAQCSHLLCSNCLNPPPGFNGRSSVAHTCPLCNATSAIVRLDDQIPPDVSKIISPCMEGLENAMECAKFQFGNAVALIQYLKTCRNTQVAALKTAIKTHVENSLAQTSRIQTLTSENESLKQEIASIQHKLSRQQISHQQQPRLHTSAPQIKTHLPAATPLFSVPPPMQPRNLENQQQHDQLPFKHQQSNQHAPRQVQQRASHPHSPQQPFSNQHMQPIPPYSRSETPISISYTSNVSSRAVTPAPMDRSNTQAPSYASNALRQQHIQTPIPPARLSLPRPGSAMSGTSGPGSVSSASPRGSMIQFQNSGDSRPASNGSSSLYAPFRSSSAAAPQTTQGRFSSTYTQGIALLPSTVPSRELPSMQQSPYGRQGSQQPMQASYALQGAHQPIQQPPASSVPVGQQRRGGNMVIDVDLDDADSFQRQKRMMQQQQRPASVASGGQESDSRTLGGVGKTVLNRGGFNAAYSGAAGPAVAISGDNSVGKGFAKNGIDRAATPQVYSKR